MFEGLEDNAAFSSNFMPTSAAGALDMYYALALRRAPSGEISELCIGHPVGLGEPPIVLKRTAALDAGDASDASDSAPDP